MALAQTFESTGQFLFRFRSQIPMLTLLVFYGLLQAAGSSFTGFNHGWEVVCFVISLLGLAVRVIAVGCAPPGTSGRNRNTQVADSLNTTGLYSLVRHPLYVGNFLIYLGISMAPGVVWIAVFNVVLFWVFYVPIIYREERYLRGKFGEAHREWRSRVYAVLPLGHWVPTAYPFRPAHAIRREYQSLFAMLAYYALLGIVGTLAAQDRWVLDPFHAWVLLVAVVLYVVARFLVKRTRLLPRTEP